MSWKQKLIVAICLAIAALAIFSRWEINKTSNFFDLRLRYNEVCCSHSGVNPYRVFSGQVEHPAFVAFPNKDGGKEMVCAYPPWHTTYMWFYGWLSWPVCVAFMLCIYLVAALFALSVFWRSIPAGQRWVAFSFALALSGNAAISALLWGNYGVLLLGLFVLFCMALKRGHGILAGVCWALMMIKPQMAVLLAWPLLFSRQWTTIGTAVGICVVATLWPAWVYHESPIDLILQIPDMALPKPKDCGSFPEIAYHLLGEQGPTIWSGLCFVLCGVFSWLLRGQRTWVIRCAAALCIFPVWTYSQGHDWTVQMALYVIVAAMAFSPTVVTWAPWRQRFVHIGLVAVLTMEVVCASYLLGMAKQWFNTDGLGWIHHVTAFGIIGLMFCMTLVIYPFDKNTTCAARQVPQN